MIHESFELSKVGSGLIRFIVSSRKLNSKYPFVMSEYENNFVTGDTSTPGAIADLAVLLG